MVAHLPRPVNWLGLLLLAACAAPPAGRTPAPVQRPAPLRVPGELGAPPAARGDHRPGPKLHLGNARLPERLGGRLGELEPPTIGYLGEEPTILEDLGMTVEGGSVGGGGELLDAALEELPADRAANGIAGLDLVQLFGDTFHPGLCEDPEVLTTVEHDGDDWEISLALPFFMAFTSQPEPYTSSMRSACEDALAEAGGDVALAQEKGCTEQDQRQFFPEGSPCRACLEGNGGDYAACVETEECLEDAAQAVWIDSASGPVWYEMASAYIWGCAPDRIILTLLLTDIPPDQSLPAAFDHEKWAYLCIPYWEEALGGVDWYCFSGDGPPEAGDALLEGLIGRVNHMRPAGEGDARYHRNHIFYATSIEVGNIDIRWMWGYDTGAGAFSAPPYEPDTNGNGVYDIGDENYGFGLGGWGINPYALRPDGSDPTRLDDTLARDWLAVMATKFSTTRDGVPIATYNYNRCLEWEGPFEDGSYRCREMGEPVYGWHNDVVNVWWTSDFTQAYPNPVATLGSTGLPDPKIPGGIVPLLAGSPALADPDWDDCAWPDTFVPDLAPLEDTPGDYGGPASTWAQTYRFGKDPDLDLRFVLSTNQARDFCPEEEE